MSVPEAQPADEALVLEYARGRDERALEALIQRHWAAAYRIALRSLGDPAAAEDAAQEAFIGLARGAGRFRPGPFLPWFQTLLMNAVRNTSRGAGRRARYESAAAGATYVRHSGSGGSWGPERGDRGERGAPDHEGERRLVAEEVEEHVRRLPLDVRFAVILHYYEGKPHEEVAQAIGCPKGTAASRIRRGLERLKESLVEAGYAAAVPEIEALMVAAGVAGRAAIVPAAPAAALVAAEAAKVVVGAGALKAMVLAVCAAAAIGGAVVLSGGREPPGQERAGRAAVEVAAAGGGAGVGAGVGAAEGEREGGRGNREQGAENREQGTGSGAASVAGPSAGTAAPSEGAKTLPASAAGEAGGGGAATPPPPAGAGFSGRVEDRGGKPIAGIRLVFGAATGAAARPARAIAMSDAEGRFTLAGVDPLEGPLWAMDDSRRYAPWSGEARDGVLVALDEAARIAGRVVTKRGGEPVEGAEVTLSGVDWWPGIFGPRAAGLPRTDASGTFELAGLPPGKVVVGAEHAPYVGRSTRLELTAGARVEVLLELGEGGTILGRVVGPDGAPVVKALVVDASELDARQRGLDGVLVDALSRRAPGPVTELPWLGGTMRFLEGRTLGRTDAEGRFTLSGVAPGSRRLVAAAPGLPPATTVVVVPEDGARIDVTIQLRRGGALEGTIRTSVMPRKVFVSLTSPTTGEMVATVPVEGDGSYRIAAVLPGTYSLMVVAEGALIPEFQGVRLIEVRAGETTRCDVPGAEGRGSVVRGAVRVGGLPIEEGLAFLYLPDMTPEGYQMVAISSGAYRFEGVRAGRYNLLISEHAVREVVVGEAGGEIVVDLDLPSLGFTGRVADAEGRGLKGVDVEAQSTSGAAVETADGPLTASAATEEGGAFTIAGLDRGEYVITARLKGHAPARVGPFAPAEAPRAIDEIRLVRGGTIRARVIGVHGEAVRDGYLVVTDAQGAQVGAGRLAPWLADADEEDQGAGVESLGEDEAPQLEVTGVPAGTYHVAAGSWHGSFERRTGVRFDGTEVTLDFALAPGGAIEVLVRDGAAGVPCEGARLALTFPDGTHLPTAELQALSASAPTRADGAWRAERLAAGRYTGAAWSRDGRAAGFEAVVRDGEVTRVVVELP